MKNPTMIYAPVDDKFIEPGVTTETKDYLYKVVDADEVKDCKGWFPTPELKRTRGKKHAEEFEDL